MRKFWNRLFGKHEATEIKLKPWPDPPQPPPPAANKHKKRPADQATADGKPYINVLGLELDPNDIGQGSFELEWNQLFINQLIQAGYRGATPEQIVDQWFQTVCRHIMLETYEQSIADPEIRANIKRKDIGNGRVEVS